MTKPILSPNARIGVVNRGEAAVRFIRAVREYNAVNGTALKSVVFYLDVEEDAVFVKEADSAVALSSLAGYPGSASSPYLDRPLMIDALGTTGCSAVWCGWGFVSEDAEFVEMVERAGIVFLGPSSDAMALLGDKIAAKELAEKSDVPILDWSRRPLESLEDAESVIDAIGYPCIIKAANAGGGRGIRFVRTKGELAAAYASARDETIRITGNDVLFVEQLVETARHLEVQAVADRHGNVVTFGVRDCSVQRRNQKIIEETPPPGMADDTIAEIEAAAARLIAAAKYESAGTVEFLCDAVTGHYYFMEVNTRLQVEHPITESLYGVDLVKMQLDVASGHTIASTRPAPRGSVIEVRLNAEDPDREFAPCPGKVLRFTPPAGPGVRVDSGIEEGSVIPQQFDSMVAKIIASGSDRSETIARLRRALTEMRINIEGGTTNRAFLLELLRQPEIVRGGVHTRFVEQYLTRRDAELENAAWPAALVACAVERYLESVYHEISNFKQQLSSGGYPRDIAVPTGSEIVLNARGHAYTVRVHAVGDNTYHIDHDDGMVVCRYVQKERDATLVIGLDRYTVQIVRRGDTLQCELDGVPYPVAIEAGGAVKAPSPSLVLSVSVQPGDRVAKGDLLCSLEAMKMEMIVSATDAGVVKEIYAKVGEQVAAGQALMKIELGDGEKAAVAESAPLIRLPVQSADAEHENRIRELIAVFLGYDHRTAPEKLLDAVFSGTEASGDAVCRASITALEAYVGVETLFSGAPIRSVEITRPASYYEYLAHYFRRTGDRGKGLPSEFLDQLEHVLTLYPRAEIGGENRETTALFRIYTSHAALPIKQALLQRILFELETCSVPDDRKQHLTDLLDEVTYHTPAQTQALTDAAIYLRYHLVDRGVMNELREEKRDRVARTLSIVTRNPDNPRLRASLVENLVNTGHHVVPELVRTVAGKNDSDRALALEILARRMNRDRTMVSGDQIEIGGFPGFLFEADDVVSIVAVSRESDRAVLIEALERFDAAENAEIIAFVLAEASGGHRDSSADRSTDGTSALARRPGFVDDFPTIDLTGRTVRCSILSVGSVDAAGVAYTSYRPDAVGKLVAAPEYLSVSPLQYRELHLSRLSNFTTRMVYRSDSVYVMAAVARDNPRDERLFALVDVPSARVQFDQGESIQRMIPFENVLMEAIYAMRAEQAGRKRRLYWNRIIINMRTDLRITIEQVRAYARRLAPRMLDLGIEKLVTYSRRRRPTGDGSEEIELQFENIYGMSFSLSSRPPSSEPLQTLDAYVDKVVRSRQRGTTYPYELVKMITRNGYPVTDAFPRGEFEEYDIEIADDGTQKLVSVKGRPYGKNTGNIVFGIINNHFASHPGGIRRVIILSDSTTDLGALAEQECRRINAALDLAESLGVPVEWLPISAGARIDMASGTENLDWTACTLRHIIEFTQRGGEINIIVGGINVGAQSYWNAEATMLMHTRGVLIMTEDASMLLTGKKALEFSGSVSAEDNVGIGGAKRIMAPNGQAQVRVKNVSDAYAVLFRHYLISYAAGDAVFPRRVETADPVDRDVALTPYEDSLNQGFSTIGDVFSETLNGERKKPFDMRQVMRAVLDADSVPFERWNEMRDAEVAVVWEARIGGYAVGLIGIESRPIPRIGEIPHDGPETWTGGTLFPLSSKKVARSLNAFSRRLPVVILANLSGFDGSPESLRKLQLEYGAEIGRAIVNFEGPIVFVVTARYHGGAYVVFSKTLNPDLHAVALEGAFASVIGGAPAAAVVFPGQIMKETYADERISDAQNKLKAGSGITQQEFDELFRMVHAEKQNALAQRFDRTHSVERAKKVGSLDAIIKTSELRPYIVRTIEETQQKYLQKRGNT